MDTDDWLEQAYEDRHTVSEEHLPDNDDADVEMAYDIAAITHDDWLANGTGPAWFEERHNMGICNMCQERS